MPIVGPVPFCFLTHERTNELASCFVQCYRNQPLQEGVGAEAAAFSAHEQLDNLIIMYDSNDVTLDKMAEFTMSEDTAARYVAYGWDVVTIDGHDLNAVSAVSPALHAFLSSLLLSDFVFLYLADFVVRLPLCAGSALRWLAPLLLCRRNMLTRYLLAIGCLMGAFVLSFLFCWLAFLVEFRLACL